MQIPPLEDPQSGDLSYTEYVCDVVFEIKSQREAHGNIPTYFTTSLKAAGTFPVPTGMTRPRVPRVASDTLPS